MKTSLQNIETTQTDMKTSLNNICTVQNEAMSEHKKSNEKLDIIIESIKSNSKTEMQIAHVLEDQHDDLKVMKKDIAIIKEKVTA